jgi:hypothetical protein
MMMVLGAVTVLDVHLIICFLIEMDLETSLLRIKTWWRIYTCLPKWQFFHLTNLSIFNLKIGHMSYLSFLK